MTVHILSSRKTEFEQSHFQQSFISGPESKERAIEKCTKSIDDDGFSGWSRIIA